MSAFTRGFNIGFLSQMFGGWGFMPNLGCCCNPFGFGGFNSCWNPSSLFMVPNMMMPNFYQYATFPAIVNFPQIQPMNFNYSNNYMNDSVWNFQPSINTNPFINNLNLSSKVVDSEKTVKRTNSKSIISNSDTFERISLDAEVSRVQAKVSTKSEDYRTVENTKKTVSTELLSTKNTTKKISERKDGDFDKMLEFVLLAEGGYVANDGGQATNKGVQQTTYDSYRVRNGLQKQAVRYISNDEVRDIYYRDYYLASGADKIKDSKLALQVFDTAVNMGVGAAKKILQKSNNNIDDFIDLRLERYEEIATKNSSKSKYLNGWKNRVSNAENFANKNFDIS